MSENSYLNNVEILAVLLEIKALLEDIKTNTQGA